jgi:hypothetical protein
VETLSEEIMMSRMKSYYVKAAGTVLLCLLSVFPLTAADETGLYIEGLEALAEQNPTQAVSSFSRFLETAPDSPYAPKAEGFLNQVLHEHDDSGIVTFYLGNLVTATYTAMMLPDLLSIPYGTLTNGIAGIAGVAAGLGGSALMARDVDIPGSLSWWMTTVQMISIGNYLYLNGIIDMYDLFGASADRVFLSGQLTVLNASRISSYVLLRNRPLSSGKGSFLLHSYAWANLYYWLSVAITQSDDLRLNSSLGLAVTDTAAALSLEGWEHLRWSPLRTGLISVSGIGGGLLGWFASMVAEEYSSLDESGVFSFIMGGALAGQAVGTVLTSGMEEEKDLNPPATALVPVVTADQAGFMVSMSL